MNTATEDLIAQGDALFSKRSSLMTLWQEIAENFYPERADFTTCRTLGADFAADLNSSYPIIVRRELGSSLSAISRRKDTEWFKVSVKNSDMLDNAGREWLEFATQTQREAMYDPASMFERATKEADQDYATFGQAVLAEYVNHKDQRLQYRCFHLRDVAWGEDENGAICERHHNVKWSAKHLVSMFGDKVHPRVKALMGTRKDPSTEINCRRIIIPAGNYDDISRGRRIPWVSVYIDLDNKHVMDERPSWTPIYIIPRWQTVSGSQYAYSPAVVAGLPDARLIQAMTLTLLEAGEMSVRPPMLKSDDVIQGGAQLYAGGVTSVDASYDQRLGKPLQAVYETAGDIPFGMEMLSRKEALLERAFFLNKIRSMPPREGMTAYEASQHVKDWIREALPLFEPLESEYNAPTCDQTFTDMRIQNAFGPAQWMPRSLSARKVEWKFQSPLSDAIEREKGQKFMEARGLIAQAVALDPGSAAILDAKKALRDALNAIGVPAKWMRDEREVEASAKAQDQQKQQDAAAEAANLNADTAQKAGAAAESFSAVA